MPFLPSFLHVPLMLFIVAVCVCCNRHQTDAKDLNGIRTAGTTAIPDSVRQPPTAQKPVVTLPRPPAMLQAIPSLYLLDSHFTVLLKDAPVETVCRYFLHWPLTHIWTPACSLVMVLAVSS